jgi:hypothetical protein
MKPMSENEPVDPLSLLAAAWQEAGQRAPAPVTRGQAACMLPGCGLDGWVQLKTKQGLIVVCFGHFQELRDRMEQTKPGGSSQRSGRPSIY